MHTYTHIKYVCFIYLCVYVAISSKDVVLSVDRNLSSFYILAIANSAAMNPGVHVLFKLVFPFSPDIYTGV